ncbi:beta-lactamase-like protein [Mycotypha africana]|uniref:beta-lactamase-like protein n=1 Tax=Mycotypha africana TaxID=64632 RepID=UPI0023019A68|nr:beta-lactamase-like protein [Mycotypha africana]KAI8977486.1 beta-lactamase-like protein [Mycotypha africana]
MVVALDITFLGTGSAQPSATRNHQAIALRTDGEIWLFDCGEATQHQFQKSKLKMGKITRIFITHMHGDHCFGLAPLLCSMTDNLNPANQNNSQDEQRIPIDIYGPSPLRSWLRTTLTSTYSNLGRPYRVHELLFKDDPVDQNLSLHNNELPGENIHLNSDHVFALPLFHSALEKGYRVQAAPILHSISSLGYVITEPDSPGKLNALIPIIKKHAAALKEQHHLSNPMTLLGDLQRTNQPYTLPDGTQLLPPPRRPGRQIVILGDTYDPSAVAKIVTSENPAVLVHEATNALTKLDFMIEKQNKRTPYSPPTFEDVEKRAKEHGHSTPQMAAAFAKRINCQKLILTHFSARYRGDDSPEAKEVMEEIRNLAVAAFDNRDQDVFCARDLWTFDVKMTS